MLIFSRKFGAYENISYLRLSFFNNIDEQPKLKTHKTMTSDYHTHHEHDDYGELVCSKAVRAGKRTYFIDVKATRGNDYYLSITESRKRINHDGSASFTRHQMHLYKEDFGKFVEGLNEMIDYIKTNKPDYFDKQAKEDLDKEFESL